MIPIIKAAIIVAGFVVPVLGNVAPNIQLPDFLKEENAGKKISEKLDRMSALLDNLLGDEIGSIPQNCQPVLGAELRGI